MRDVGHGVHLGAKDDSVNSIPCSSILVFGSPLELFGACLLREISHALHRALTRTPDGSEDRVHLAPQRLPDVTDAAPALPPHNRRSFRDELDSAPDLSD
eukprot:2876576-Pyramimonas_sp.AAC.1